jgi:hypothetical protein
MNTAGMIKYTPAAIIEGSAPFKVPAPMLNTMSKETIYGKGIVRIGFGGVCIGIDCSDPDFLERVRADYHPFLVTHQPDFLIKLNLRDNLTIPEIKQLLINARSYIEGDRYFTKPELMEYRVDWGKATLYVDVERGIFSPEAEFKLMNSLIRGIYFGIYAKLKNAAPDAYLVHGCGIIDGKRCYLFTGPSGSGKTTVARLAEGRRVLNDETVLIGRNGKGFYVSGTPFNGGVPNTCNTSAYLSVIFFLKHETRVSLRRLGKTETYLRFITQVFDTVPLFEASGIDSLQERANLSAAVAAAAPSYELGFRPDTSFWQVVENI